jgi:hypothetical protein
LPTGSRSSTSRPTVGPLPPPPDRPGRHQNLAIALSIIAVISPTSGRGRRRASLDHEYAQGPRNSRATREQFAPEARCVSRERLAPHKGQLDRLRGDTDSAERCSRPSKERISQLAPSPWALWVDERCRRSAHTLKNRASLGSKGQPQLPMLQTLSSKLDLPYSAQV